MQGDGVLRGSLIWVGAASALETLAILARILHSGLSISLSLSRKYPRVCPAYYFTSLRLTVTLNYAEVYDNADNPQPAEPRAGRSSRMQISQTLAAFN